MDLNSRLLLFIEPTSPELFVRWQIVELIRKRVLGFSFEDDGLIIHKSKKRKSEDFITKLESLIAGEVSIENVEYQSLLKKLNWMKFKDLVELTFGNEDRVFEKRRILDRLKNIWHLTPSALKLKDEFLTELEVFAEFSRKRNIGIDELYRRAKLIHSNILMVNIILWKFSPYKVYKTMLSQLNIKFIEETMDLTNVQPKEVIEVFDFMLFGAPHVEKLSLGLENFIQTGINGYDGS